MKILWICNTANKQASEYMNNNAPYYGGWMTGLSESLQNEKEVELVYCYPKIGDKKQDNFIYKNIHYYSFYLPKKYRFLPIPSERKSNYTRGQIKQILNNEKPDIVHIFGTEYIHSLIAAEEVKNKRSLVTSIQGLTSIYAEHFLAYIPHMLYNKRNFSAIFRGTLKKQKART